MNTLRQLGYGKDDIPKTLILRMESLEGALALTPKQAAKELAGWHLGDTAWYNDFEAWIENFGGSIHWDGEE